MENVRVISGTARGKRLKAPPRERPLTDQAKEALFNILSRKTAGSVVLDLFAGSGAVGIESLSRGGARAVFVELNRKNAGVIKQNLEATCLIDLAEVLVLDVIKGLKVLSGRGDRFDIIFLGAPYDSPKLLEAMELIGQAELLSENGVVIAEHRKQHQVAEQYDKLRSFRENRYGDTVFTFYKEQD